MDLARQLWDPILAFLCVSHVTLDKSLNLSGPWEIR